MLEHARKDGEAPVTVGVDTHLDEHVAVVLEHLGRPLDAFWVPTTGSGYAKLLGGRKPWASWKGSGSRVRVPLGLAWHAS